MAGGERGQLRGERGLAFQVAWHRMLGPYDEGGSRIGRQAIGRLEMGDHLAIGVGARPLEGGREVRLHHRDGAAGEAPGWPPASDERAGRPEGCDQHDGKGEGREHLARAAARGQERKRLGDRDVAEGDRERDAVHPGERGHLNQCDLCVLRIAEQSPRLPEEATAQQLGRGP